MNMDKATLLLLVVLPLSASFLFPPCNNMKRRKFLAPALSSSGDENVDPRTLESLSGKSVIVTGASSGLGKELALKLSYCQLKHLVLSGRNVKALGEVKLCCEKMEKCGEVHVLPCDLSEDESVIEFAKDALEKCDGSVDMLILNGGMSSRSSFLDTDIRVDELLMKVNFLSGASISKQIIPSMVKRKAGAVVWISSLQGKIGTPFRTSYAASKFAVQGYCEALRAELAPSGVTVHCVSPGYINTNLSKNAATGDGSKHGQLDETTANGADPADVAIEIIDSVVTWDKSDFIVAGSPSARIGIALKLMAPKFLEKKLVSRYLKSSKQQNNI